MGWKTLPDGRIDTNTQESWTRDLSEATMITGDLNLLETQLVAHYYISDLNAYLFGADDPGIRFEYDENGSIRSHESHKRGYPDGQTLIDALETAIRRSVGQKTIDEVLVSDREVVESETKLYAQDTVSYTHLTLPTKA